MITDPYPVDRDRLVLECVDGCVLGDQEHDCASVASIPLTKGQIAIIDRSDLERVGRYRWYTTLGRHTYYARRKRGRSEGTPTVQSLHAFILDSPKVDHVNGNGLDNRRSNLRVASSQQNGANTAKAAASTSRFKGVSWFPRFRRWRAYISMDRKQTHLGYFDHEIAAAHAYDAAARELFGQYAAVNFPRQGEQDAHRDPNRLNCAHEHWDCDGNGCYRCDRGLLWMPS